MPTRWNARDERQYAHVKASELERGRLQDRAEEIAARTVNKQRREEGRTPQRASQGTGNPQASLDARTRQELYNRARQLGIPGRSRMRKAQLVEAIRAR